MPRAIWSGSISFGLVNIPVKLFNAVSRKSVSFNQNDSRTGARIKYQKVSGADGSEVPNDAIVKGYELPSGEYVLINDDELATLDPEAFKAFGLREEDFARSLRAGRLSDTVPPHGVLCRVRRMGAATGGARDAEAQLEWVRAQLRSRSPALRSRAARGSRARR